MATGYTTRELVSVASAAEYLGLSLSEFQATGVYVIDFLTQRGGVDPTPLSEPPVPVGGNSIEFVWSADSVEVLDRVTSGYEITGPEAQKFGAILLTFFVGLTQAQ